MGAVAAGIAIDAAVTAAAAASEAAAATAAETAAAAAAEAAADAAADGAADAGADAGAAAGEATNATVKILQAVQKLSKLIKEFFAIDAVFKSAMAIIKALSGSSQKMDRLKKLINVLVDMEQKMTAIRDWLDAHKDDTAQLDGIDVPVDSGILAKFMTPLASGAGVLQTLANQVSQQNDQKQEITDDQISSLGRSLGKVADTFESLATFIKDKGAKAPVLTTLPINMDEVNGWRNDLN